MDYGEDKMLGADKQVQNSVTKKMQDRDLSLLDHTCKRLLTPKFTFVCHKSQGKTQG